MLFWIPQNPVDLGHLYWQSIIWKTLIFWHTQPTYQTCSLLCCVNYPTSENINLYSKPNQFIAYEFQGKNCYLVTPPTYSCVIMDWEKVHQYRVLTEHFFLQDLRERESKHVHMKMNGGRGRSREPQANSLLSMVSPQRDDPMTYEIMTWAKIANQMPNEQPRHPDWTLLKMH